MKPDWLGGYFDGRGCFDIHKFNPHGTKTYTSFRIKVMDVDDNTLKRIRNILGFGILTKDQLWITKRADVKKIIGWLENSMMLRKDELLNFKQKLLEYEDSFKGDKNG